MINFMSRARAVLQIRTGFVAFATGCVGLAYAIATSATINPLIMFLFLSASFAVNVVANIANGIAGASKEDNLKTINDEYKGKNGLVTGKTTKLDAYIALLLFTAYTIGAGLLIVILTHSIAFLAVGMLAVAVAMLYSFGPIAFTNYPISEIISGFFCGFITTLCAAMLNGVQLSLPLFLLAISTWILVAMLMLVNNLCDIEKDRNHRTTLPMVVGEKIAIKLFPIGMSIVGFAGLIAILSVGHNLLALAYIILNTLLFTRLFFQSLITVGVAISGNKGKYIPLYLRYYYRTIILLCIALII